MNDSLGNALMVKVRDLLAKNEVFEQRAAALTGLEEFWSSLILSP